MKTSLLTHFVAAIIVTGIMMTIYATVQQAHRSAANDPQLQMARDISIFLSEKKSIDALLPKDTIDIAKSLGVFVILYDEKGNAVGSTGLLEGKMPQIPPGVMDFTKANHEDAVTWQPQQGVRIATVVESVQSPGVAYVAAGRSLIEVEIRESNLVKMVFIAWLLCLGIILVHWLIHFFMIPKKGKV